MKSNIIVWIALGLSIVALGVSAWSFFGSDAATSMLNEPRGDCYTSGGSSAPANGWTYQGCCNEGGIGWTNYANGKYRACP